MKKFYLLLLAFVAMNVYCYAQVKASYLYSTSMPYGTLDIRTKISSSNYFYLQDGKTFSYRETSPGVRTNKFLDMTSFDSNPYGQGNLRRKNGTKDLFVMNYRLLQPLKYSSTYSEGYPLLVLLHGAVERANCYYNACYHSNWSYDPNTNSPAAPKASNHKLLNNDHNLSQGGKQHMDARNKAAGKLPNDPTVAGRMFPGFVLVPQMFNEWNAENVQDVARLVQLIAQKYNIDENRIYIHGLSIGGYAVYEALRRASWLFAAAQPMSAVNDADIRSNAQVLGRVVHVPLWIFQGGNDKAPSPTYTNKLVTDYQNAGAVMRYSLYSGVGHTCWHKAFAEPEFYSWLLKQSKTNIHVYQGITAIQGTKYPKLMLAEGFFKYQWEKDGKIVSGTSHTYIAKLPGKYRARFSRVANPTASQWNKWSPVVTITNGSAGRIATASDSLDVVITEEETGLEVQAYPNPSSGSFTVHISSDDVERPVSVKFIDQIGRPLYDGIHMVEELEGGIDLALPSSLPEGMYILKANQGVRTVNRKVIIKR